jgi:hypothetical protein
MDAGILVCHVLVDRDDVDAFAAHCLQHGLQLVLAHREVAVDDRLLVAAREGGPEEVVVERGHLESGGECGAHRRIDLVLEQHRVAHQHGAGPRPTASRPEMGLNPDLDEAVGAALCLGIWIAAAALATRQ